MLASFRGISTRGKLKVLRWVFFGTLTCVAVSLTYNWLMFRHLGPEAFRQGIISAIVLPMALACPLFFYLTLKLRELAILNYKLADLAAKDGMTNCLNRASFLESVERWSDAHLSERVGAFLIVDIDHFKQINDRFGHAAGDEALVLISAALRNLVRPVDLVARLGGEEFGIFLPQADTVAVAMVAERTRKAIADIDFSPNGNRYHLSASIGATCFRAGRSFAEAYRIADRLLYDAKHAGRNCVRLSSEIDSPELAPA